MEQTLVQLKDFMSPILTSGGWVVNTLLLSVIAWFLKQQLTGLRDFMKTQLDMNMKFQTQDQCKILRDACNRQCDHCVLYKQTITIQP